MTGSGKAGLKPWDIAAGMLLVREAGGFVSDLSGGDRMIETGDICAGNEAVQAPSARDALEGPEPPVGEGRRPVFRHKPVPDWPARTRSRGSAGQHGPIEPSRRSAEGKA